MDLMLDILATIQDGHELSASDIGEICNCDSWSITLWERKALAKMKRAFLTLEK